MTLTLQMVNQIFFCMTHTYHLDRWAEWFQYPSPPSPHTHTHTCTFPLLNHHHHYLSLSREGCWAPQMISLPVPPFFPVFRCPLGLGELQACPFPDVVFQTLSPSTFFPLAKWFWPDLMNGRHDHITAVCVSLQWSGLHVVSLPAGSWHDFLVGNVIFVWDA